MKVAIQNKKIVSNQNGREKKKPETHIAPPFGMWDWDEETQCVISISTLRIPWVEQQLVR